MFRAPLSFDASTDDRGYPISDSDLTATGGADQAYEAAAYRKSFWALLNRLSPEQRTVLSLIHGLEGESHSPAEVVKITGLTITQVNRLHGSAKHALRATFSASTDIETRDRELRYEAGLTPAQRAKQAAYELAA